MVLSAYKHLPARIIIRLHHKLTITPTVDAAVNSQCKSVAIRTLRRRHVTERAALIKGESTWDGLAAGRAESQTAIAALTTRTDCSVSVNHKCTILSRFHLQQISISQPISTYDSVPSEQYSVSKKNWTTTINNSFTNSQRSLIIFGTEIPYSILH